MSEHTSGANGQNETQGAKWYSELRRDGRWKARSGEVIARANYQCEDCGSPKDLQAHHVMYIPRRMPWDYPLALMRCVCPKCHVARQQTEREIYINVGSVLRDLDLEGLKAQPIFSFFDGLGHE